MKRRRSPARAAGARVAGGRIAAVVNLSRGPLGEQGGELGPRRRRAQEDPLGLAQEGLKGRPPRRHGAVGEVRSQVHELGALASADEALSRPPSRPSMRRRGVAPQCPGCTPPRPLAQVQPRSMRAAASSPIGRGPMAPPASGGESLSGRRKPLREAKAYHGRGRRCREVGFRGRAGGRPRLDLGPQLQGLESGSERAVQRRGRPTFGPPGDRGPVKERHRFCV